MYQVKKKIISTLLILSALLMTMFVTALGVNAMTHNKKGTGFNGILTYNGDESVFLSMKNSASVISHTQGYEFNCKYASCKSYHWDGTANAFIQQDSVNSGYVTSSVANTATVRNLTVDNNTDKSGYYGELYENADQYSDRVDRYWVTRYRNKQIAAHDGVTKFNFTTN